MQNAMALLLRPLATPSTIAAVMKILDLVPLLSRLDRRMRAGLRAAFSWFLVF
jgi:hypothetical protein